ncbi:MAG: hypothetical protein OZSIB_2251 [Candidatus Ozemobacter sibiricus]|jgi:hypothetical protein|uniref:Uncharacterized protein n=1 Tax=Candidatus Ozemobacter sibiricus TaxID=2268124 RepID=A0A367ZVJ9_9BACT|nr:MAG: hypothetical protein OZSIB_2251 [Candidatus Ozemobacter sibiricus]
MSTARKEKDRVKRIEGWILWDWEIEGPARKGSRPTLHIGR